MKRPLAFILSVGMVFCFVIANVTCKGKKKRKSDNAEESTKVTPKKEPIEYDFSCLEDEDDGGQGRVINIGNEIENGVLDGYGDEVTIEEEEEVGQEVFKDCEKDIISDERSQKLASILKKLVREIEDPRGFHYDIYLVRKNELNAWTCGGKIFVTTKMIDFCNSDDELACVIGHEINHNELGHIKHFIQKRKWLSDLGAAVSEILTMPFGQKDEAYCDLKGIDLVYAAGYDGCQNVDLWRRMKQESKEGDYNALKNLFRSHPYSEKRADCSRRHISDNYEIECENTNEAR
jgi:beta-barrel assembly-enhancing protease